MPIAVFALTICAFGIGTSEFVLNGLLPDVAADLHVSIPAAGLLVSGFAIGIIVGAPTLTVATLRMRRKTVLQSAVLLFIAGSLLSAIAPNYWILMIGRILSAMAVGAVYGVGSVVVANLVPPNRRAGAIALMFAGATAATVFGVPLGTLVGQHLGWRATFWVVTGIGVVGLLAITGLIPSTPNEAPPSIRNELRTFRRPQVWLTLAMTACSFGAIAATFTYITPLLTDVTGFSEGTVTILLFVVGAGLFAGNYVGGKWADRSLMPALIGLFSLFVVVLAAFTPAIHNKPAAVVVAFLFGVAGYGLVPGCQVRVVAKAEGAPTLASATNISAFNVGVTAGSALGGAAISAGWGYVSVTWVSAAIAVAGLLLAYVSKTSDARAEARSGSAPAPLTRVPAEPSETVAR
ncbi:MFS transporter [Streptomyces sp. URMC 127]|uniref:MFS transporter n=1 Tax=Streptomyces sp. URMC 127 TaxID=3423402 RepID=UPI003F1998B0